MGRDARASTRRRAAKRAAATAVVAAVGFGFGIAALGLGAAAIAAGEWRHHTKSGRRDCGFFQQLESSSYGARRRRPVSDREFRGVLDKEGRVVAGRFLALRVRVAENGADPDVRPELWPLLLGVRRGWGTAVEIEQARRARRDAYGALVTKCAELDALLVSSKRGGGRTPSTGGGRFQLASSPEPKTNSSSPRAAIRLPKTPCPFSETDLATYSESIPVIQADVPRTFWNSGGGFELQWARERIYDEGEAVTGQTVRRDDRAPMTGASPSASQSRPPGDEKQTRRRGIDPGTFGTPNPGTYGVPNPGSGGTLNPTTSGSPNPGTTSGAPNPGTTPGTPRNVPTWQAAQAKRLQNVLTAYCLHDKQVGYCQGMNEVAARFLEMVPDESEAFWCFARFLTAYRGHFIIDARKKEGTGGGGTARTASTTRSTVDTTGTTSTTSTTSTTVGTTSTTVGTTSTTVGTTSTVGIITGAPSTTETKSLDESLGQKPPGSSVVSKSTTSSKRADETRSETGKKETFSCSPQKNETVRDVLRELGRILKRCDPPMWKHILLLNSGDCMFAFRAVVVLLCRVSLSHFPHTASLNAHTRLTLSFLSLGVTRDGNRVSVGNPDGASRFRNERRRPGRGRET